MSMGVKVVAAQQPLDTATRDEDEAARHAAEPDGQAVAVQPGREPGRRAVRQRAGHRLRLESCGRRDRSAGGRRHRHGCGARASTRRRTTRSRRSIARWKAGVDVQYVPGAAGRGGRYVINGLSSTDQDDLVKSLALVAERVSPAASPLKKPRIGVFSAPTSMDEGWTRWVLDQYGFEYVRVPGADIQAGHLRDKIDVLLITDEARGVFEGGGGRGGGGGGAAAVSRRRANPEQRRSRESARRIRARRRHARLLQSQQHVRDRQSAPAGEKRGGRHQPHAVLHGHLAAQRATSITSQRVMAGMPDQAAVFYDGGPVFETTEGFKGAVLAKYQDTGSPLASGYMLGEKLPARQSRRARRLTRRRPRRAARLPAAVARPAVRDLQSYLQRVALLKLAMPHWSICR